MEDGSDRDQNAETTFRPGQPPPSMTRAPAAQFSWRPPSRAIGEWERRGEAGQGDNLVDERSGEACGNRTKDLTTVPSFNGGSFFNGGGDRSKMHVVACPSTVSAVAEERTRRRVGAGSRN